MNTQQRATEHFTQFVETQAGKAKTWILDDASSLGHLGEAAKGRITLDYLFLDRSDSFPDDLEVSAPAAYSKDATLRFYLPSINDNQFSVERPTEFSVNMDNEVEFLIRGVKQARVDGMDINVLTTRLIALETEGSLRPSVTVEEDTR